MALPSPERQLLDGLLGTCQAVAAQIVGAALEQRDPRRAADGGGHERQVLGEQLVLQRARAGRDQHARCRRAARAPGRRRSCRCRCPPPRPAARARQRAADALGHAQLLAPHLETAQRPLQRPTVTEYVLKLQHVRKRARGGILGQGPGPAEGHIFLNLLQSGARRGIGRQSAAATLAGGGGRPGYTSGLHGSAS